jgi:exoribonuclease-2
VRHGRTAALAAPFRPKDATLFSIISSFDATYGAYGDFQHAIERFWTLRWLAQEGVDTLDGVVLKDGLVRADTLPLVLRVGGAESLARGTPVRMRIVRTDLLTLEAHATLLAQTAAAADAAAAQTDMGDEGDEGDEADQALTLTIAVDLDEAQAGTADGAPPAA